MGSGASIGLAPESSIQREQGRDVIDLTATLHSGQVFHWLPTPVGFAGCIGEIPIHLKKRGAQVATTRKREILVRGYLGLDRSLEGIIGTFPADPVMSAAVAFCPGLRLVEQPLWECLATFLTSALKQIPQISAISLALRNRFGRSTRVEGFEVFTYPGAEVIAKLELADLLACKLGFRAKNVLAAARMVDSGEIDLAALRNVSTEEARSVLYRLPGVGEKIANCVLLFGYQRFQAFPIDVWIERMLREIYFAGRAKPKMQDLQSFAAEYFGPFAGYAQQYLFHYWRLNRRAAKL
jgi:N-glycosylase/DNA lyase